MMTEERHNYNIHEIKELLVQYIITNNSIDFSGNTIILVAILLIGIHIFYDSLPTFDPKILNTA